MALVEFALLVPVLMLLYFGTVELTNVLRHARKLDILSRTIGDSLSQRTQPTSTEIEDIFKAAAIVMAPYDGAGVQMSVSAVGVGGILEPGPLRVCSSVATSGAPVRVPGTPAPVAEAEALQPAGSRLLLVEITAAYRPVSGPGMFRDAVQGIVLARRTKWPVRYGRRYASQSPEIILPNGLPCPS
ncbi:TadE/TadG family type IV pilus assembly protein [Methylobacterium sp. J-090]|uniref:TadE/TadG family type IV pilus assembly protein n=1 Tax=Methylobacterium sp. J-090 TaxID=2836666 RepID=UPI001FBA0451|nr:TadE/TadG family type IV pilus assembly protein [Methylobacterium sp. J-090]MCJ2082389.1 pilus assembly protein [Methylobacterium sp. J-090]